MTTGEPTPRGDRSLPDIDGAYMLAETAALCRIPSPSGFTKAAIAHVAAELERLGLPTRRTVKGALVATLPGGAAGIGARLQTLRHFEKQMLAHGSGAGRAGLYREKRASERHRIDELSLVARASARRPEEHSRIDALTRLVARADARFDFLTQLNYGETQ